MLHLMQYRGHGESESSPADGNPDIGSNLSRLFASNSLREASELRYKYDTMSQPSPTLDFLQPRSEEDFKSVYSITVLVIRLD
jgi:hypothetical protein